VQLLWRTPSYHDYHWVIRPDVAKRYGADFPEKVSQTFLKMDPNTPEHQEILELFSAEKFIVTNNDNYRQIEAVGREIGKIQ
jgi:phosphonate transport system substrate-binding protein